MISANSKQGHAGNGVDDFRCYSPPYRRGRGCLRRVPPYLPVGTGLQVTLRACGPFFSGVAW